MTDQKQAKKAYIYSKDMAAAQLHKQSNEAVKDYIGSDPKNVFTLLDATQKYKTSVRNAALLLTAQKGKTPEAFQSFNAWQKQGLQVRKGAKGVAVVEPRADEKGNIAMTRVFKFPLSATTAKKERYDALNNKLMFNKYSALKEPTADQFNKVAEYYHLDQDASDTSNREENGNRLVDNYLQNRDQFIKKPNKTKSALMNSIVKYMYVSKDKQKASEALNNWKNDKGEKFVDLPGKEQAKLLSSSVSVYHKLAKVTYRVMNPKVDRQKNKTKEAEKSINKEQLATVQAQQELER